MKSRVSIFIFFFFIGVYSNKVLAQTISEEQKKELKIFAEAFCADMTIYSGPGVQKDGNSYSRISNFFAKGLHEEHVYDLFNQNIFGQSKSTLGYLEDIETDYDNNIDVEYTEITPLNCLIRDAGNEYAIVRVKKKMTYKGKTKTEDEVIFFNLNISKPDQYMINGVGFAATTKYQFCFKDDKEKAEMTTLKQNLYEQKLKQADIFFEQKKYYLAQKLYNELLDENKNTPYLKEQIAKCNRALTVESYENIGDSLFKIAKYYEAKIVYKDAVAYKWSTDIEQRLVNKIQRCDEQINEQNYIREFKEGERYLQLRISRKATYHFSEALRYKKNDPAALSKLGECKRIDPNFIKHEIENAITMAESSPKNWGKMFKIFFTYEASGFLTTENYYNMVMMLDEKNRSVKKEMRFSSRDFNNYLKIYIVKLRRAAADEQNDEIKSKVDHLLNNIINKKYQHG